MPPKALDHKSNPHPQTVTREQKARPALESIAEKMMHVLEQVCRDVQIQAQLYQESVRDQVRAHLSALMHVCRDAQAQLCQEHVRGQLWVRVCVRECVRRVCALRVCAHLVCLGQVMRGCCTCWSALAADLEPPALSHSGDLRRPKTKRCSPLWLRRQSWTT